MAKNKSIIQQTKECFLCRMEAEKIGYFGQLSSAGLHKHHFMHGTANRKLAEQYGLYAYLCEAKHHEHGPESAHGNPAVDLMLKQIAQRRFEAIYGHEKWMQVFGKNYLEEEEWQNGENSQPTSVRT